MLSLRQLLTPVSEDDFLAFLLGTLDSLGFTATSWQSGGAARTLTQLLARVGSDLTYAIADITAGGFAGLAKGAYADMVGLYMFNLTRVQASSTIGQMVLTSSPAAAAHTFAAGELLIGDKPLSPDNTFQVLSGPGPGPTWTLNPGTSMLVTVASAVPGSKANGVPTNSGTLAIVGTPLAGVSVSNPTNPPATPTNTWITVPGQDKESDGPGGRYNARMIGRWDRLSYSNTEGAYRAWVLEALPAVTRLTVRPGVAPLVIHIAGATATGGLTGPQISTIVDYLNGATDGVGRRPMNDILEVVSANVVTSPALALTIYVKSPFSADAITRVNTALIELEAATPIGGKRVLNTGSGYVFLADLYNAVMSQQGLQNVLFSLTGDIPLGQDDIYAAPPMIQMVIVP